MIKRYIAFLILPLILFLTLPLSVYALPDEDASKAIEPESIFDPGDVSLSGSGTGEAFVDKIEFETQNNDLTGSVNFWTHVSQLEDVGSYVYLIYVLNTSGTVLDYSEKIIDTTMAPIEQTVTFDFSSARNGQNILVIVPEASPENGLATTVYAYESDASRIIGMTCGEANSNKGNVIKTEKFRIEEADGTQYYREYTELIDVTNPNEVGTIKAGTGFRYPIKITYTYEVVIEGDDISSLPVAGYQGITNTKVEMLLDTLPSTLQNSTAYTSYYDYKYHIEYDEPTFSAKEILETTTEDSKSLIETDAEGYLPGYYADGELPEGYEKDPDQCVSQYKYKRDNDGGDTWYPSDIDSIPWTSTEPTASQKQVDTKNVYQPYICYSTSSYKRAVTEYTVSCEEDSWIKEITCDTCYKKILDMDNYLICLWSEKPRAICELENTIIDSYKCNCVETKTCEETDYKLLSENETQKATCSIGQGCANKGDDYGNAKSNFVLTRSTDTDIIFETNYTGLGLTNWLPEWESANIYSNEGAANLAFQTGEWELYDRVGYVIGSWILEGITTKKCSYTNPRFINGWYDTKAEAIDNFEYTVIGLNNDGADDIILTTSTNFSTVYTRTKKLYKVQNLASIPAVEYYVHPGLVSTNEEAATWIFDEDTVSLPDPPSETKAAYGEWYDYEERDVCKYKWVGSERTIYKIEQTATYELPEIYAEESTGELTSTSSESDYPPTTEVGRKAFTEYCEKEGNYPVDVDITNTGINNYTFNISCNYGVTQTNSLCGSETGFGINQYFRSILYYDMFPGRDPGENWEATGNIIVSGETISGTDAADLKNIIEQQQYYSQDPLYQINLSKTNILRIRNYNSDNENMGGYLNYYKNTGGNWNFYLEFSDIFE